LGEFVGGLKYRMKGSRGLTATTTPLPCQHAVDERGDQPPAFGRLGFGVPEPAAELGKGLFGLVEPWVERRAGSFELLFDRLPPEEAFALALSRPGFDGDFDARFRLVEGAGRRAESEEVPGRVVGAWDAACVRVGSSGCAYRC
jgi:hypothetical protein